MYLRRRGPGSGTKSLPFSVSSLNLEANEPPSTPESTIPSQFDAAQFCEAKSFGEKRIYFSYLPIVSSEVWKEYLFVAFYWATFFLRR